MNLQEHIRRILREELSPRIKRRFSPDELENEFLESFEHAYNLTKKRKVLSSHFLDELINTTITMMMDGIHYKLHSTLPEDERWYDDIHQELENHYKNRIEKFYKIMEGIKESTSNIRTILKEERKMSARVRRRLGEIDNEFNRLMSAVYRPDIICGYKSGEELLDAVGEAVIEVMYYKHFKDMDDNTGEWAEIYWDMVKYVRKKYVEKIKEYYHINCGD